MGVIQSPHGIQGQVKIKIFTTTPSSFTMHKNFLNKLGEKSFTLKDFYSVKEDVLIGSLEGIKTRNQAENLKGTELYIAKESLPSLEEEEYYYQDLIDLEVKTAKGELFGNVKLVYNFGSGDLIEIQLVETKEIVVIPFTKEAIPSINLSEGSLTVNEEILEQFKMTKKIEGSSE